MIDDPYILPLLEAIQTCVCAELDDPMCLCYVTHGDATNAPAIPVVGRGVAWVGVNRIFPAVGFGIEPEDSAQTCATGINAELTVGVLRCYSITKDNPNAEETLNWTRQMLSDMNALRKAILCCDAIEDKFLGEWLPRGPEGGVYGGSWTVTVG